MQDEKTTSFRRIVVWTYRTIMVPAFVNITTPWNTKVHCKMKRYDLIIYHYAGYPWFWEGAYKIHKCWDNKRALALQGHRGLGAQLVIAEILKLQTIFWQLSFSVELRRIRAAASSFRLRMIRGIPSRSRCLGYSQMFKHWRSITTRICELLTQCCVTREYMYLQVQRIHAQWHNLWATISSKILNRWLINDYIHLWRSVAWTCWLLLHKGIKRLQCVNARDKPD